MRLRFFAGAALLGSLLILFILTGFAVPPMNPDAQPSKDNPDANGAAKRATVAGGLKATVWAAEPLMANPVSFCFDGQGRAYVAETTRFEHGVPDTRGHMYWLDEDIGSRSVEDRLKMYEKHKFGAKDKNYEEFDDQVRMVWDSTGSKVADKSTVFAKGFNKLKDGLAAGVLARKGQVYLTAIPDLYILKDTKNTGVADVKTSLATGFGIRAQFLGHDMHGLRMGPDGRLYFSIGDRGLNVTTIDKKKLFLPDEGCVLRCDVDGKNMEIVHTGLRNPQELAFDDFGNLFTYDNNCDSGDSARWVQITEGGDSGWRCGYQYGTLMHTPAVPQGNRGPWNTEKLWHLPHADSAAYVLPPLAHFGNGPAGLTHYPGIGFNDKYKDHFFACDFTSNAGSSKIWAVSVKPKGATFEVNKPEPFVTGMVPTDCEFGPDGAFYWSDWVSGWAPQNRGRIFRVEDPEGQKNPAVAEAKKLLAEGFEKLKVEELAKLLGHPHQQVRLEAQYELATRPVVDAIAAFEEVAKESKNQIARLHAIWGLGQCNAIGQISNFSEDKDDEIRAQVGKTLATRPMLPHSVRKVLVKMLTDKNARVQAQAAIAFGKTEDRENDGNPNVIRSPSSEAATYYPLFELLKSNADKDVYLRQAAVQGLVGLTRNGDDLFTAWTLQKDKYDTAPVRMGVVLALRRLGSEKLSEFLSDSEPKIVVEAARAIHDNNEMRSMPFLAAMASKPGLPEAVAFRALSACFKIGMQYKKLGVPHQDQAAALANFAARPTEADHLRVAALKLLGDWAKPSKRDGITGLRQDLAERSAEPAVEALKPVLSKIFVGSETVRKEAVACTTKLGIQDVGPLMLGLVSDPKQTVSVRVDSLFALNDLKAKELSIALAAAKESKEPKLRGAVRVIQAKADPATAAKELPALLADSVTSSIEKQMAFEALGALPESPEADKALAGWLDVYLDGKLPDDLKLDVLEAAKARAERDKLKLHAPLREKLKAIDTAARAAEAKDPLSRNREALAGGDAEKGRNLFLNSAAVYCQRCHKLDGQGGEVGPAINGVAKDKTREYLLESIVLPSKAIAKGFESVILVLLDGRTVSGVLRSKDTKAFTVVTPENKVIVVPKDDVDIEKPDKSAMPEDLVKKLSKRELRDLVEFLSSLKEPAK